MDYCLFKLHFDSAVHFGPSDSSLSLSASADHFCADTLFSALCHTAGALFGPTGIEKLCQQAAAGELLLSDSMPWRMDKGKLTYYLPKPCVTSQKRQDIPAELRKAMKQLSWIALEDMRAFGDSLKGKKVFSPESVSFGVSETRSRAAVQDHGDARPYQVETFRFFQNCGLYFLAGYRTKAQRERLQQLVHALGLTGIGGKVSSGLGSFTVEQVTTLAHVQDPQIRFFYDSLMQKRPQRYLLLTTSLPTEDELPAVLQDAQYQLVRRGGFIQSSTFSTTPQRKATQYFFAAGAMLSKPFSGMLYNTVTSGAHPVYRYAKPILLGVAF